MSRRVKLPGSAGLAMLAAIALCGFAPRAPLDEGDTPLEQQMVKIDDAMLFLRRSLQDAKQDAASFEQIATAQRACVEAKQLDPKMAPRVAESERAAFLRDYRKGMAAQLIEWAQLETALLDGDREAAQALWKKLDRGKEAAHERFTEGE